MLKKLACTFLRKDQTTEYLLGLGLRHSSENCKSWFSAAGRLAQLSCFVLVLHTASESNPGRMDLLNWCCGHCTPPCAPSYSCSPAAHRRIHRHAWTLCCVVLTSTALTLYTNKALQYLVHLSNKSIFLLALALY